MQYRVNEGVGLVTFEVENRNPERGGEYTIQLNTVPGSAIASTNGGIYTYYIVLTHVCNITIRVFSTNTVNGDYVRTTQTVRFSPGTQSQTVLVPLINNNIFESTEDFSAQLTTSDRRVNIVEPMAVATIVDDDTGMHYPSVSLP